MITVLLTCLVLAGSPFIPPKEWSVDKVEVPLGVISNAWTTAPCSPGQFGQCLQWAGPLEGEGLSVKVHLRRTLKPGERVDAPERCQVAVEAEQRTLTGRPESSITLPK
jgi:hypothetical protein